MSQNPLTTYPLPLKDLDMEHQHVPHEVVQHILSFIPGPSQQNGGEDPNGKDTLLACALVCKAWLSPARRHLLSLYFPTGKVPIEIREPQSIIDLTNLLQSPLCTFDLGFIKTLALTEYYSDAQPRNISPSSFLAPLSALDTIPLPSLQGLIFDRVDLRIIGYKDDAFPDSVPPAILSQIKILEIDTIYLAPFESTAGIIQLCPSLEAVTIYGNPHHREPNCEEYLTFQPPPKSLRCLNLDVVLFQDTARWLMACQPNHTNITTLIIDNFEWSDRYCWDLWPFLDKIGPNLEVFEVYFSSFAYGYHKDRDPVGAELSTHAPPENRFARNVSLKKFAIGAPLHIITKFLPFFFEQAHFAPHLEVLDVFISSLLSYYIPLLGGLAPLDDYLRSRPSFTHAIFSPGNISSRFWGEVETLIKKSLPGCGEKAMIEFRQPPEK